VHDSLTGAPRRGASLPGAMTTARVPAPARPLPVAWLAAVVLVGLWLLLAPPTPDLAAQVYRAHLFDRIGFAVWDASWYGGHHMPGYSLLFPPLGALLGARAVGALAAVASVVVFERLLSGRFSPRAVRLATLWLAVAVTCDLLIGRITFSLGVPFGLGAALALEKGRPTLAAALGVACAAGSPVAGVFASLVGAAVVLAGPAERRRGAVPLAVLPVATILVLAVLFPEGGRQPFVGAQIIVPLVACGAVLLLLRPGDRVLRVGVWLYVAGCVATMLLPTPLGDNVLRLGALLGGPLIAALWVDRAPGRLRGIVPPLVAAAAAIFAVWQVAGPVREVMKGVDDPSTHRAYYQPLVDWVAAQDDPSIRIEVPFTRGHWEAAYLAPHVPLARGWETQLDVRYGALFYADGAHGVTPARYHAWLRANAVRYVALPDAVPDRTARREVALVRSRPDFLTPVWSDAHWQVFAVRDPEPLVEGGRLTALRPDGFTLDVPRAGNVVVRVRPTPYFIVTTRNACVVPSRDGWTHLRVQRAGPVRLHAGLTVDDVLGDDATCPTA
jgi:hypothetical protein